MTRTRRLFAVARLVLRRLGLQAAATAACYPASEEYIYTTSNPSPTRTYQPPPPHLRLVRRRES